MTIRLNLAGGNHSGGDNSNPNSPPNEVGPIRRVLRMKTENVHPTYHMVLPPAMHHLLPRFSTRCRFPVGERIFKMDYVVRGAVRKFKKRHWERFVKKFYVEASDEVEMDFFEGIDGGDDFFFHVRVVHHVSESPDEGSVSGSNSYGDHDGFFH